MGMTSLSIEMTCTVEVMMTTKSYEIYITRTYTVTDCFTMESSTEVEAVEGAKLQSSMTDGVMEMVEPQIGTVKLTDVAVDVYSEEVIDD